MIPQAVSNTILGLFSKSMFVRPFVVALIIVAPIVVALIVVALLLFALSSYASPARVSNYLDSQHAEDSKPPSYTIIEERDHDPKIFTQGFDLEENVFYESSGLFGKSFVRSYKDIPVEKYIKTKDLVSPTITSSGKVITENKQTFRSIQHISQTINEYSLPKKFFAEGIVKVEKFLYLLTWQSGQLLILNAKSFDLVGTRQYSGEGWGITHDGTHFIMSNGSEKLFYRDSKSFEIIKQLVVGDGKKTYKKLNELEYANRFVWANVWLSNDILKIDPSTGQVVDRFDLSAIAKKNVRHPMHTVLNGIAYDKEKNAFWITGKYWPKKYLVRFK